MKSVFVTLSLLFSLLSPAQAGTCNLEKPIPVGDLLNETTTLRDVRTDEVPRFTQPENYDPARDTLSYSLFNIKFNRTFTGFLGGSLSVDKKFESVGFSNIYSGTYHLQGGVSEENGVKAYTAKTLTPYDGPAKGDAITESVVKVKNGQLISVVLKFPVFKFWRRGEFQTYTTFTGEHQTLCVRSAR